MHTRTTTAALALTAAALLAACGPTSDDSKAPATSSATTAPASTPTTAAPKTSTPAPHKPVPKLIGMGLQSAQDTAQAAGFYNLTSHDSAGRDRQQLLDRDWKVCSQTPAAGKNAPTDTAVDLGAVKLEEACPRGDQAPPAKAGKTMSNFVGKGLNTATEALPSGTSITPTDAAGSRMILVESNWKVCTQSPKAGAVLAGQPVTFTAVKFGESCP